MSLTEKQYFSLLQSISKSYICHIYVVCFSPSIQFYIYVTYMYSYVKYMCGNGRYVTFGKGVFADAKNDVTSLVS